MFWHPLPVLLSPLASLLSGLLLDHRDRQSPALRQQVLGLQRQLEKRAHLSRTEKLMLLLVCARSEQQQLLDCLTITKPATPIGWHRQVVRRCWTSQPRRRPGRPRTAQQAEQLVLRLARENAGWGCGKIAGEMRKLGFARFGRPTVQRILRRHGLWPRPGRGGLSWRGPFDHYAQSIWACDFFTAMGAGGARGVPGSCHRAQREPSALGAGESVSHYNSRRPHRSLDLRPPEGPVESPGEEEVLCCRVLGGLINDYYREAA